MYILARGPTALCITLQCTVELGLILEVVDQAVVGLSLGGHLVFLQQSLDQLQHLPD